MTLFGHSLFGFWEQGLRSKWLEQELATDSAATASQLSLPMYPLE